MQVFCLKERSSSRTQSILGYPGKCVKCNRGAASKLDGLKCAFLVSFKFE